MTSFILVVLITFFPAYGTKTEQRITLQFHNETNCREVRNLINVGLSFYDLASKNTNYSAYVGRCTSAKRKPVKQGGRL